MTVWLVEHTRATVGGPDGGRRAQRELVGAGTPHKFDEFDERRI